MSNDEKHNKPGKLREYHATYHTGASPDQESSPATPPEDELVRTQVYLSASQREFLQEEGRRRGVSMAAALRQVIDTAMKPTESSWARNPLLEEAVADAAFHGDASGSESPDAAIYGEYQP